MTFEHNIPAGIARSLEEAAKRRRELAKEQPLEERHIEAANLLNSLADQFSAGDFAPDLMAKYIAEDDAWEPEHVAHASAEVLDDIGFETSPGTPDEFLRLLIEKITGTEAPTSIPAE